MNYERMTLKLQEALQESTSIAQKKDHSEVGTEHLLFAFLTQQDGIVPPLVSNVGVDANYLANETEKLLEKYPVVHGNASLSISNELQKILAKSENAQNELKDEYLSCEHVFIAMAESDGNVGSLLKKMGINKKTLLHALKTLRGNNRITNQDPESTLKSLEKYCKDLTALARQEKIDPVIGRDEEIRRIMQVLSRRTKNNPVLVGEPGVGKTAIAEGLAQRIFKKDVPENLKDTTKYYTFNYP